MVLMPAKNRSFRHFLIKPFGSHSGFIHYAQAIIILPKPSQILVSIHCNQNILPLGPTLIQKGVKNDKFPSFLILKEVFLFKQLLVKLYSPFNGPRSLSRSCFATNKPMHDLPLGSFVSFPILDFGFNPFPQSGYFGLIGRLIGNNETYHCPRNHKPNSGRHIGPIHMHEIFTCGRNSHICRLLFARIVKIQSIVRSKASNSPQNHFGANFANLCAFGFSLLALFLQNLFSGFFRSLPLLSFQTPIFWGSAPSPFNISLGCVQ